MTRATFLITLLLFADATASAEPDLLVVINEANPISALSRDDLCDLFLKKSSYWTDGTLVLPVDQDCCSCEGSRG